MKISRVFFTRLCARISPHCSSLAPPSHCCQDSKQNLQLFLRDCLEKVPAVEGSFSHGHTIIDCFSQISFRREGYQLRRLAKMAQALRPLLVLLAIGSCIAADHIDLWPMPKSVTHGAQRLYVSKDATMSMVGSTYSDEKAILKDAFQRMLDLMKLNHNADDTNRSSFVLTGVNMVVHSPEDEVIYSFHAMNSKFL